MKRLLLVPFIVWNLQAQDYEGLLQEALQNSPYLKANALEVQRADEQSSLLQRYKNPTLSLEASQFNPDVGKSEAGYRAALSQPIRLWGVGSDRETLAAATKEEAKGFVTLKRAEFVKVFSLLYNEYITQTALLHLAKDELTISKNIAAIAKARYEAGSTAKVKYLQAKVDFAGSKNLLREREAMQVASYYKLLAFCGLSKQEELAAKHTFTLSSKNLQAAQNSSAELRYIESQQKRAGAQAKLSTNKIEWVNLYAEYEKEPDQGISRIGVDIPLAVFNTKTEEKRIASLKAKQSEFLLQNQKTTLLFTLKRLQKEIAILENVILSTKELYSAQKELLKMYEEGYKIASINLLELQNIKNQMIRTKEKEIRLQSQKNKNIVIYNYEAGEYNE